MNDLSFTTESNNWNVTPTRDFEADCRTGNEYAHEFLAWVHDHWKDDGSLMLTFVLEAMGLQTKGDGIKIGFLGEVGEALLWTGYRKEDIRQEFRVLYEAIHRMDSAIRELSKNVHDDDAVVDILTDAGSEAVSIAMTIIHRLPEQLGSDISISENESGKPFQSAYNRARDAGLAWSHEMRAQS